MTESALWITRYFGRDPGLYLTALGLVMSTGLLFYLVRRWGQAWESDEETAESFPKRPAPSHHARKSRVKKSIEPLPAPPSNATEPSGEEVSHRNAVGVRPTEPSGEEVSLPNAVRMRPTEPSGEEVRPSADARKWRVEGSLESAPPPESIGKGPIEPSGEAIKPPGGHSLDEVVEHLNSVHRQIQDLQYVLQGLENTRAEELHDIQKRLKEIEDRFEAGPSQQHGPVFPV